MWYVNFSNGQVYFNAKTANIYYVRAVRAGQCVPQGTTTTTTLPDDDGGRCPLKKLLGPDNQKLENLRDFRDSSLAQSAVGRKVIQIYYNNADSINRALERSPALKKFTLKSLEAIAPMAGRKQE